MFFSMYLFVYCFCLFIFFFKQKTAYEMRISDWSSDVCSSDLLFLDIGFEDDAVGRAAFLALDLQIFLEIAKAVDAALGALDAEAVERVALVQTEFAAHHLVVGQRVAVDVDALDISPRAFADVAGDRHRPVFGIRAEEHTSELQ